jgi:hypothetical protein
MQGMRKVIATGKDGKPTFEQGVALAAGVALLREYEKLKVEVEVLRKVKDAVRTFIMNGPAGVAYISSLSSELDPLVRALVEADAARGRVPR